MTNKTDRVDIGRVFFYPLVGANLRRVNVLKLESHVNGVVQLVERFDPKHFKVDCTNTREWLMRAAKKHDDAKPITFRVLYRDDRSSGKKALAYSFAGHRFKVADENRYVELLIRLHHEFSVDGIAKAIAELKANPEYEQLADNFPIDLYTLEMCDQIEAEIETYAFTGAAQPRVFMDFHSRMREDGKIEIAPFDPFDRFIGESQIRLSMEYYKWELDLEKRQEIAQELKKDNPRQNVTKLRNLLVHAPKYAECQQKEMVICRAE